MITAGSATKAGGSSRSRRRPTKGVGGIQQGAEQDGGAHHLGHYHRGWGKQAGAICGTLWGSPPANRSTTVINGTTPDDDHGHSPSFGSLVVLEVVYHVGEVGSGGSLGGTGSSHRKVTQHRVQWGDRNAMCSDQFKFVRELGYTVYQVKLPT
jgi:hypothetical protein